MKITDKIIVIDTFPCNTISSNDAGVVINTVPTNTKSNSEKHLQCVSLHFLKTSC